MLKRVRLKTCVVDGRREASTVEAMSAALVESEAGNLFDVSQPIVQVYHIGEGLTLLRLPRHSRT